MFEQLASIAVMHRQKILIAAVVIVFLLFGAVTEAAAHNPSGVEVSG